MPLYTCPDCKGKFVLRTKFRECPNCGFNPERRKTNIERITEYMESSPLNQAFVMSAVSKMADHALADPENLKKKMSKNGSANFISPEAWIQCAKDFKEKNPEYFK